MEPHPVAQNIIDVEFKLFGSFTLKQFSKMLIGSLVGVGIFFLNINPIIKYPLIIIVVLLGIGMAIIPNLKVWTVGFLKAIFVSPRYVWMKQPSVLELFEEKKEESSSKDSKDIQAMISKRRINIDDLPFDNEYNDDNSDSPWATSTNKFESIYDTLYDQNNKTEIVAPPTTSSKKIKESKGFASQFISRATQSFDIGLLKPKKNELNTQKDYLAELEKLRKEMDSLNKNDFNYEDRRKDIVLMMNQVYSEYKSKVGSTSKTILKEEAPKILATQNGKIINGIVVAKNDSPIPNVEIYFKNLFYNKTYKTISMGDGRFSTNIQIPQGDYDIRLSKYGMKFHNYKINISNQKPPAYKFREK